MADAVLPRKQIPVKSKKVEKVQVEDTEKTCRRIHLQMHIIKKQCRKAAGKQTEEKSPLFDCLKKE